MSTKVRRIATPPNTLKTNGAQDCTVCGAPVMYAVSDHRFIHMDSYKIRCAR